MNNSVININVVTCYGVSIFVAGIGYFCGKVTTEKKYRPMVENLLERVRYLEKGIAK